jgi:hypothetical protein
MQAKSMHARGAWHDFLTNNPLPDETEKAPQRERGAFSGISVM